MYCDPQQFDGAAALLYHNNHDGTFTEVSRKAGVRCCCWTNPTPANDQPKASCIIAP